MTRRFTGRTRRPAVRSSKSRSRDLGEDGAPRGREAVGIERGLHFAERTRELVGALSSFVAAIVPRGVVAELFARRRSRSACDLFDEIVLVHRASSSSMATPCFFRHS